MRQVVGALALVLGLVACESGSQIELTIIRPEADTAVRYELRVYEPGDAPLTCVKVAAGEFAVPLDASLVHSQYFGPEPGMPVPGLSSGDYLLLAFGRDADCRIVSGGCTEWTGDDVIRIDLESVAEPWDQCRSGTSCNGVGECVDCASGGCPDGSVMFDGGDSFDAGLDGGSACECNAGGVCMESDGGTDGGSFICDCSGTGYTGPLCSEDLNECDLDVDGCDDDPDACINDVGTFACQCPMGYGGDGIGEMGCSHIACATNPCDEDGDTAATCDPDGSDYSCSCNVGFNDNGTTCENIDDCLDNPCDDNGDTVANCTDEVSDYSCDCSTTHVDIGTTCSPFFFEEYIKASNTDASDYFGESVALSEDGDTLAIGAWAESSGATGIDGNEADDSALGAGAVYVLTRSGSAWNQQAYIKASNAGANDSFGHSVALSADGNTLAVGAWGEASNAIGVDGNEADNTAADAGAVYIFTRSGSTWTQQAYVKASNTELGDRFGYYVALSGDGDTLAVGAYLEDSDAIGIGGAENNNNASGSGAVYVFTRSGSDWTQQEYIKASNAEANDYFGYSLGLSYDGSTLAVGALEESSDATGVDGSQVSAGAPDSGAAYVFTRSGSTWTQQAYVKASNTGAEDAFGFRLAISDDGNTLAVAAYLEDSSATGIGGTEGDNSAGDAGAVYVFARSGSTWTQQAYVKASNTDGGDLFGVGLSLSETGDRMAVGAEEEDSNATLVGGDEANDDLGSSGAVYIFLRTGTSWSQEAYVKSSNSGAGDLFGGSVAISGDGNTVVAGATGEDSNATGIDGNQADNSYGLSGACYVY